MTKNEFIAQCVPYDTWKLNHDIRIKECFENMKDFFDIEGFLNKYENIKADRKVLETILYDAFENNNYDEYERDDQIARMLYVPLEEIMEFEKWNGE